MQKYQSEKDNIQSNIIDNQQDMNGYKIIHKFSSADGKIQSIQLIRKTLIFFQVLILSIIEVKEDDQCINENEKENNDEISYISNMLTSKAFDLSLIQCPLINDESIYKKQCLKCENGDVLNLYDLLEMNKNKLILKKQKQFYQYQENQLLGLHNNHYQLALQLKQLIEGVKDNKVECQDIQQQICEIVKKNQ